jgi:hypothetical protein
MHVHLHEFIIISKIHIADILDFVFFIYLFEVQKLKQESQF